MYNAGMKNSFIFLLMGIFLIGLSGNVKADMGRKEFSKERIRRLVPIANEEIRKLIEEGKRLLKKKEFDKAIKLFTLALEGVPYHPAPYFFLAKTYFLLGKDQEALAVLEKAGRTQTDSNVIFELLSETASPLKKVQAPLMGKVSIAPFKGNKQAAMSFSFDDGALNVYTTIIPLFEQFGFRATIPINPGMITEKVTNPWWGSWEQWRDAQSRGFEISNHAMEHHDLTKVSAEELEFDVNGAYDLIKEKLGVPPLSFAFPQDLSDQRTVAKVSERHIAARQRDILIQSYDNVFIPVYGGNSFSIKTGEWIVDLAILKRLWVIAECHSVATEDIKTYKPITTEFLEAHLTYIKENEDKIWVDTFIHVYLYLLEKKSTKLYWKDTSSNSVKFTFKTILNPKIFSFPLTVVIDTSPVYPKIVSAFQQGTLKALPVKIMGDKLHVEVVPGTPPVEVTWE